jgi:hypothetical protein
MGGNTSLRIYHSFGACVSSYLLALSLEQFVWLFATMVCMRLCSMFYMCRVEHYACSLVNL